jgi:hypothetical protein
MLDNIPVEEPESGMTSLEEACSVANHVGPEKGDIGEMRLKKIHAFLVESLEKADPFQANLGAISSDLALMAFRLNDAIDDAMNKSANPLEDLQRLMPALEAYLRIARQFDRLGQLNRVVELGHGRRKPK